MGTTAWLWSGRTYRECHYGARLLLDPAVHTYYAHAAVTIPKEKFPNSHSTIIDDVGLLFHIRVVVCADWSKYLDDADEFERGSRPFSRRRMLQGNRAV